MSELITDKMIEDELMPYAGPIFSNQRFLSQKQYIQHGTFSVYSHELHVAHFAIKIDKVLGLHCDRKALIRGALLHDYFLYDWHVGGKGDIHPKLHGFYHPGIALSNADRDFALNDREKDAIRKHMWPLTVIPPSCREAWAVTIADKWATVWEKTVASQNATHSEESI